MNALPYLDSAATAGGGDIEVSFEFFPPRSQVAATELWGALLALESLGPRFVSVTCGACGTARDGTQATVGRIRRETSLAPAAHLTCVGASRAEVNRLAESYWEQGVRHIVALRGDGSAPGAPFEAHPDGYANAAALVAGLKRIAPFEVSVAAYPECHPESPNKAADLDNLWRKIDAGADRAITQFFFAPENFLRFRDQVAAVGIDVELVPGILPIANMAQTQRFAGKCGASMPEAMLRLFEGLDDRPEVRSLVAASVAADLCARLCAEEVRHFHFFTLNRAELTYAVCHLLGLRPKEAIHEHSRAA